MCLQLEFELDVFIIFFKVYRASFFFSWMHRDSMLCLHHGILRELNKFIYARFLEASAPQLLTFQCGCWCCDVLYQCVKPHHKKKILEKNFMQFGVAGRGYKEDGQMNGFKV